MAIKQPDRELSQALPEIITRAERDAERAYGRRVAIVMILAPFDEPDVEAQYIANVEREVGVDMLRKLFARWNIPIDDVPAHEKQ
jgi:hypothetical protein